MNITQELVIEHQLILTINQHILEITLQPSQVGSDKYFSIMNQYVSFIENFIDDYHHVKEEEFLFEALSLPGVLNTHLLISEMLCEHKAGRNALDLIKSGIRFSDYKEITQGVNDYFRVMSQHISKEEHILFSLAEKYLSNPIKQRVIEFYQDIEESKQKSMLWKKYVDFSEELTILLKQSCTIH